MKKLMHNPLLSDKEIDDAVSLLIKSHQKEVLNGVTEEVQNEVRRITSDSINKYKERIAASAS